MLFNRRRQNRLDEHMEPGKILSPLLLNQLVLFMSSTLIFKVYSIMFSYVPFGILVLINCRLIFEFKKRKINGVENEIQRRKRKAMNRTVIFVTLLFVIMTVPSALASSFYGVIVKLSYAQAIFQVLGRVASSYQAYNLLFLYLTNRKFAQILRSHFVRIHSYITSSNTLDRSKSVTTHTK